MDSSEVAVDLSPIARVYRDGRVERLMGNDAVPAGVDGGTGVESKDVVVSPEIGVSARIYIPVAGAGESRRLPVVVFFHGGGFVTGCAATPDYQGYMNALVAGARVVAVSVEYRRAPEHPLLAAYDDSWAAVKWVAAHSAGDGPERWLNKRADPTRIFLAGDSTGANIAHRVAVPAGGDGVGIEGAVLLHPYFWGEDPIGGEEGLPGGPGPSSPGCGGWRTRTRSGRTTRGSTRIRIRSHAHEARCCNDQKTDHRLCFLFLLTLTASAANSVNRSEVAVDLFPFVRVYKDGRVERFLGTETVPAGVDQKTGVKSKDVVFSPDLGLFVRIYIPVISSGEKLPVVVYFHGGGFVAESAASPTYHDYLNLQASEARAVIVSVDYRRAPEHPLPAAFDDSWAALKWVASHSARDGPERWVNDHADPTRLFLAGDSAGATIAHRMGVLAGEDPISGGARVAGIVLSDPYFLGSDPVGGEAGEPEGTMGFLERLWFLSDPTTVGLDDPWINPEKDPNIKRLGCRKVLVCVAEKDSLRHRGRYYYEVLRTSGWVGSVEIFKSDGEGHVFFLHSDPTAERVVAFRDRLSSFINNN